jgi:hypothetical protein
MSFFDAACAAIDRANAEDPQGREVLYSHRMVDWVRRLAPAASEELLLAARAQHLRRWTVARSSYPEGRNGYLRWREDLKKFHAETLGAIMSESGYAETSVSKARSLLVRKNLSTDAEGQTLEDAACLVFLQFEFAEFAAKTESAKMVEILRKSWGKMSPAARERALQLSYEPSLLSLVQRALEKPGTPG